MSYSCAAGFTSSASRPLPLAGADRPPALYTPPKKVEELFSATEGNKFKGLNSAIAGPRFDAQLPRGKNSFQLYSLATPNGQKAGIILEEIGAAYDAHCKLVSNKNIY